MNPNREILVVVALFSFAASAAASIQSLPHAAADGGVREAKGQAARKSLGSRAWIADTMEARYADTEKRYGSNYQDVAVMTREFELIYEMGYFGCLLSNHINFDKRGPERQAKLLTSCGNEGEADWAMSFVRAYQDSPMYVQRLGATPMALMPVEDVHRVISGTLKDARRQHTESIFRRMMVPRLYAQCLANGVCAQFGIR